MSLSHAEIRERFKKFFTDRGHAWVQSSSLSPNDPSVLFTTAGMQQFKPYYTGQADAQKDFGSLNTASIQKCIRTSDIDEVGDETHLTFFEMLGNFSFGGYWKKEAIKLAHEFITKELGLTIDYVTVFAGEDGIPADSESELIWKVIDPNILVKRHSRNENFWGPTGNEGPCGPTTEIYVGGVEIWNIVFNEYFQSVNGALELLKVHGIDTGMGLERLAMASQTKPNIFATDLFEPILSSLPDSLEDRTRRIMADHARSASFLITDGIRPSNKDQGYVLRRLLRRIIVHAHLANLNAGSKTALFESVVRMYKPWYPNLDQELISTVLNDESEKFRTTLERGLKELYRTTIIDATTAFRLYESYGLPYEIIKELSRDKTGDLTREQFEDEFKKHQEKSRAGAEKKFGGHGLVVGDITGGTNQEVAIKTRLHTATHLLQSALRSVLGNSVTQFGSDITAERLRFDFTFDRKVTGEEISRVQDIVNDTVTQGLPVTRQEMAHDDAIKMGALAFFKQKYPEKVSVYTIGDPEHPVSRELCGGPHVTQTSEIGRFKILKEESVSSGVRRIRATISD